MTPVVLRPATPADSEFCFQLHKAAMRAPWVRYVTAIWGGTTKHSATSTLAPSARAAGRPSPPAGQASTCSTSNTAPAEIYLARIEIHPDHQGGGIGSLISALIDEAGQKGHDLVLDVLIVNRRAQALCQRLGMAEVARHGEGNIKITMKSGRPRR